MLIAVLASTFVAAPAWADWGPTKWGADRDATMAALGSAAVAVNGGTGDRVLNQDLRAKRPGTFEGVKVEEGFYFDPKGGGLSVVRLEPDRADCPAFIAAARKRFGPSSEDKSDTLAAQSARPILLAKSVWKDKAANLSIMMSAVTIGNDAGPFLCQITYQPVADG